MTIGSFEEESRRKGLRAVSLSPFEFANYSLAMAAATV